MQKGVWEKDIAPSVVARGKYELLPHFKKPAVFFPTFFAGKKRSR